MRTRRLLAAAVLAALPLFVGAQHAAPTRLSADPAPALHVTERPSGPRWLYAAGWDWGDAWVMGNILSYYSFGPALAIAW